MIELAPASNYMTYEEALLYCQFLEYNGCTDWRMPTHEDWRTTINIVGWWLNDNWANSDRDVVVPVRDI